MRCQLIALDELHTARYVVHRLAVAGRVEPIFAPDALAFAFRATGCIPRDANDLCDAALMRGYVDRLREVDGDTIRAVATAPDTRG